MVVISASVLVAMAGCTSQPIRTADSPDPTFSITPNPHPTPLPVPRYAQLVDRALQTAAGSYFSLEMLRSDIEAGRGHRDLVLPTRDQTTLVHSELIKQQQLSYLRALVPPVRARQVHALLLAAFGAAIQANETEHRWVNFVLVRRYADAHGERRLLDDAIADDALADRARNAFLQAYADLRSGAGLPPLPPGMVF
jgi:hypothetical protein